MSADDPRGLSADSLLVALSRPREPGAPVNAPLVLSSTFRAGGEVGYARDGNPGWSDLEHALGVLEGGHALAFASGMAAASALLETLPPDALVVASRVAYHGVHVLLREREAAGRLRVRAVDTLDAEATATACAGADLLWLETPTNPLLGVADVVRLAAAAHARGALVVVDSTLATPLRQRPLELGADLVLHSATKYLGGHADLMAGAVAGPTELLDRVEATSRLTGSVLDPFAAFLLSRSLRTLPLRVQRQNENGRAVAEALAGHAAVESVHYPGRGGAEQEEIAARQMRGRGGMVTIAVRGGGAGAKRFLHRLQLVHPAASLGGVESLASVPRETSHTHLSEADLKSRGISEGLVRLSLGIEDTEDLIRDLRHALDAT